MNVSNIAQGLLPLLEIYGARKQNQDLNENYNNLAAQQQQQIQSLTDLYGPNSPYAQTMRQQLDRRDAASGRRSQYGPREVELMSKLAGSQAQTNQSVLNNLYSQQAMELARRRANTDPNNATMNAANYIMQAKDLFPLAKKMGTGLQNLYRDYDTNDKYTRFRRSIEEGRAIDDTYDPNLNFNSYDAYTGFSPDDISSYYNGYDYGSGLDVGDVYNYGDYYTPVDFGVDWGYDWNSGGGGGWSGGGGGNADDFASYGDDLIDWWG
jgi:hypothetical protein